MAIRADHRDTEHQRFRPNGNKAFVTAYAVANLQISEYLPILLHQQVSKDNVLSHNPRLILIPPISMILLLLPSSPDTPSASTTNPFLLILYQWYL